MIMTMKINDNESDSENSNNIDNDHEMSDKNSDSYCNEEGDNDIHGRLGIRILSSSAESISQILSKFVSPSGHVMCCLFYRY